MTRVGRLAPRQITSASDYQAHWEREEMGAHEGMRINGSAAEEVAAHWSSGCCTVLPPPTATGF